MDDKKKKKFVVPKAEIIGFSEEDIITASDTKEWWGLTEGFDGEGW